jgi:hypothetical protein
LEILVSSPREGRGEGGEEWRKRREGGVRERVSMAGKKLRETRGIFEALTRMQKPGTEMTERTEMTEMEGAIAGIGAAMV